MTTRELAAMIGKTILITDRRPGRSYQAEILDTRNAAYGRGLEILLDYATNWIQPTPAELESVREAGK